MAQLIDKDALVEEIKVLDALYNTSKDLSGDLFIQGLFCFLDTFEAKEVDLEKEINEYIDDEWCDEYSGDVGNWIRCRRGTRSMEVEDIKDIAKHFFELGLKTQKGE